MSEIRGGELKSKRSLHDNYMTQCCNIYISLWNSFPGGGTIQLGESVLNHSLSKIEHLSVLEPEPSS